MQIENNDATLVVVGSPKVNTFVTGRGLIVQTHYGPQVMLPVDDPRAAKSIRAADHAYAEANGKLPSPSMLAVRDGSGSLVLVKKSEAATYERGRPPKFDASVAAKIRRDYLTGKATATELAKTHNVSRDTIRNIARGKTYWYA